MIKFLNWVDKNPTNPKAKIINQVFPVIVCAILFTLFIALTLGFITHLINPFSTDKIPLTLLPFDVMVGFFLYFIGSISVLVAIFNLFPIPALDGGKIVFLLIEKVMGKPVPAKWEQIITIIFFVLLISMSLFITIKFDVPRLIDFVKASF